MHVKSQHYLALKTNIKLHEVTIRISFGIDGPPFEVSPEYSIEEGLFVALFGSLGVVQTHLVDKILLSQCLAHLEQAINNLKMLVHNRVIHVRTFRRWGGIFQGKNTFKKKHRG